MSSVASKALLAKMVQERAVVMKIEFDLTLEQIKAVHVILIHGIIIVENLLPTMDPDNRDKYSIYIADAEIAEYKFITAAFKVGYKVGN